MAYVGHGFDRNLLTRIIPTTARTNRPRPANFHGILIPSLDVLLLHEQVFFDELLSAALLHPNHLRSASCEVLLLQLNVAFSETSKCRL